jgi:ligand-binding SRPBCC domain-containing protein
MSSATVVRSSLLRASAADVWARVTRMDAINREMMPFMRMTYPREAEGMTLDGADVRLGEPLFRSWVLLGGILPIERMDVTLVELDRGKRFVEQSRTLAMRRWRHERTIEPAEGGCRVTDRLTLEAPMGALSPVIARLVGVFFDHRHRQLRHTFGTVHR